MDTANIPYGPRPYTVRLTALIETGFESIPNEQPRFTRERWRDRAIRDLDINHLSSQLLTFTLSGISSYQSWQTHFTGEHPIRISFILNTDWENDP